MSSRPDGEGRRQAPEDDWFATPDDWFSPGSQERDAEPAEPGRTDRVLPGEGVSGTKQLVDALDLSGFSGCLDVEIFSEPDRFWGLPVEEAARRAYAAASALVS